MKSSISFIKLEPDQGKYLTQASLAENDERIFSESVYCPQGKESEWIEVDESYKEAWEAEHPIEEPNEQG